jgi:hypothetical protein
MPLVTNIPQGWKTLTMLRQFVANRITGGAAFALAVLLLAYAAAAKAPAAPSGKIEGRGSVSGRGVPGVLLKAERDHDDRDEERSARSGKIEGRVLDTITGRGVPGVFVIVVRDRDGRRWLSEPTNSSGHYLVKVSLRDAEAFHTRTRAFDYADTVGSGSVSPGRPLRLDFSVALRPTATVSGTVLDADTGLGVANAVVAVSCLTGKADDDKGTKDEGRKENCNGIPHPPALTGPDGSYELHGVPFTWSGPVENGTPIQASMLTCLESDLYYPQVADTVTVDSLEVVKDFRVEAVPCGSPPPPPPIGVPVLPPSCAGTRTPPPTVDNHGRLVTYCLGPANEADLAVNPLNPQNIVIVAKDYSLGKGNACAEPLHPQNKHVVWIGVYTSFDGGVSWSNDLLPGFPGDSRPTGVPNQRCMSDPVVAFAPNGNLFLAALAWGAPAFFPSTCGTPPTSSSKFSDLILARSADGGRTWQIKSLYCGFTDGLWPDHPQIAIDLSSPSHTIVYIAWDLVDETKMRSTIPKLTKDFDFISDFTEDIGFSSGGVGLLSLPTPAVLKDASVVMSGRGFVCTDCVSVVRNRVSGGPGWDGVELADLPVPFDHPSPDPTTDNYSAQVFPTIAVDRSGGATDGAVAIAWHNGDPLGNTFNHLHVAYIADIRAFPVLVSESEPLPEASQHQVLPRVAVAPSGTVALLYYNDALTLGPGSLTTRYSAAMSSGPPNWGAPATLSTPFSPDSMYNQVGGINDTDHKAFIGDYVGLIFDASGNALSAWADGRNDRSDIFFKKVPPGCPGC